MDYIENACAVIFNNEKNRILGVSPRWDRGMVLLPGGQRRDDETLVECLLRELNEELKIGIASYEFFDSYDAGKALYHNEDLRIYAFLIKEFSGELNASSEIMNKIWVPEDTCFEKGIKLASVFGWLIPGLVYAGHLPEETLYRPIVTTFNPISPSQPQDSSAHLSQP